MNFQFTKRHPGRLFLGLLAVIFVAELLIMFVLERFLDASHPQWLEALLDSTLLTVLCAPLLWRYLLRPLQSALEQESVKAQVAMKMAAEGIITLDERGIIQTFNRAAESIFGFSEEEARGLNILQLICTLDADNESEDGPGAYLGLPDERVREAQGLHKNGATFPAELAISELKLAGRRQFTLIVRDITARRQAQIQLEQVNEQLSSIFAHIHGLIAYLDPKFNFIRVNQAYADADGRPVDFFAGKNNFKLYPDPDNEALFCRVLKSGESRRVMAKPFEHPDHPERGVTYWDWGLYPVKNAAGQVHGLLLFLTDVTAQQRARIELQESEERYRALFDYSGDAILFLRTTPEGRKLVVEANEMASLHLGYRHGELVGMDVDRFSAPDSVRPASQTTRHGCVLYEAQHQAKDGRLIPVEVHSCSFQFRGEPMTLAVVRDITERKEAEKDKDELRRNMQSLLNSIQESTFLLDRAGRLLIVNEVGAQRFNSSPAELIGRNVFEIMPLEVARFRREKFNGIAQRGLPETYEDERCGRRFLSTTCPVRGAGGEVTGFAVYAADVTQQRRLQSIEGLFSEINQMVLQGEGEPLQDLLNFACDKVADLFHLAAAWVGRKEQDGSTTVLAGAGPALKYIDRLRQGGVRWDDTAKGHGPSGSAIREGVLQVFKVSDPRFQAWAGIARENNLQSILAIPLIIRGEIHGVFTLYSTDTAFFDSPSVVEILTGVSMRISVAMETAMDQQQIRLLSSALSAAGNGVMITNAQGIIQWVNPAFSKLSGYSADELIGRTPRILNSGQHAQGYYQALWASIGRGEPWNSDTTERARDGSLYTVSQTITPITNDEGKISHYIAIHEDVTAQKLTQERIEHMAHYDALTGLPNRALFYDRLRQSLVMAKRNRGGMTLLFLDLDGFKQVNDSAGHHVGDLLLKEVAMRLRACVRESDTVARLGGDEFTVILNEAHERDAVGKIAAKIVGEIGLPFVLEGFEARIGVSIGIARYAEDAGSEDELVNSADQAMYAAKSAGKNTYRFGGTEMDA